MLKIRGDPPFGSEKKHMVKICNRNKSRDHSSGFRSDPIALLLAMISSNIFFIKRICVTTFLFPLLNVETIL